MYIYELHQSFSIIRHLYFVFVCLILLLYILLSFSNLAEFSKNLTPTQFITSLIYRVALTGLFFTTVIYFLPDAIKINFGLLTKTLFFDFIRSVCLKFYLLPRRPLCCFHAECVYK